MARTDIMAVAFMEKEHLEIAEILVSNPKFFLVDSASNYNQWSSSTLTGP